MKMRWTFRCYPTPAPAAHLKRTFGCVRSVWNWSLRMRSEAYQAGERINHTETDQRLAILKRQPETVWLNEVSSGCLQQALRDQQQAFAHFFEKRAAYPATLSNGERIANPKHGARRQRNLACYQRRMARQVKGSRRRESTRRQVARMHERIADSRLDALHKFSTALLKRALT